MDTLNGQRITKISQVAPEAAWFLRGLGLSDYYVIKIYDLVGGASVTLIKEDPYWLLEDFSHMGFKKVDEIAENLGVKKDDPRRLRAGLRYVLSYYVGEGHTFAPKNDYLDKCAQLLDVTREAAEDALRMMVYEGTLHISFTEGEEAVYFYSYYKAESSVASKLVHLSNQEAKELKKIIASPEAFLRKFQENTGLELSRNQKNAVISSLVNGVTIITGGPGTGKTTIINALIYILEESGHRVAVCAPTGRAAKRIMETGGHFAQTVHRLLEYYYDETRGSMFFAKNSEDQLNYDCVIVDEASMLDIKLTEALLNAVKDGTRVVFVGDKDQLPPVGAGNVLTDLIKSEYFNTVELNEIYRQDLESDIVSNAHRINKGDYPSLKEGEETDFEVIRLNKQADIRDRICSIVRDMDPDKVQVLSPVKKGIIGVAELNPELQNIFNPPEADKEELKFGKKIFREGDRVMQIKNDYRISFKRERHDRYGGDGTIEGYVREDGKGIFNGEIGTIVGIDKEARSMTIAFEDDRFGKSWGRRFALYEYTRLDELELAYAVTIHKSQGSEYPTVIIPISWFPSVLSTRSLIYTAITRGKSKVILVGDPKYMNAMVDNDRSTSRLSGLKSRILDMYQL